MYIEAIEHVFSCFFVYRCFLSAVQTVDMIVSRSTVGKYKKGESMKKNLILSLSCVIALSSVPVAFATPDKAAPPTTEKAAAPTTEKAAQPEAELLTGKALQTMDSGGYTYVYIEKKDSEKVWIAIPSTKVTVGSQMSFKGGMEMRNFESKSLKRKFDTIIFADAAIDTAAKGSAASTKEAAAGATGGSKAAASTKDTKISVPKATGANAYTVKEIFANSAKLDKKKVVVRGKVVKVSSGIMGKNWIHIQDGTGTQAKKNHNLVCTSQSMADVDDVVTVTGTLAKDKDFGGGYKYSAILEEATFTK
jgi:hypothetical protein